jgi:hypothetical protein
MVNAFLRAKGLERSAVTHHPELAVAVSAMVLHGFLLGRASVILFNMLFSSVSKPEAASADYIEKRDI